MRRRMQLGVLRIPSTLAKFILFSYFVFLYCRTDSVHFQCLHHFPNISLRPVCRATKLTQLTNIHNLMPASSLHLSAGSRILHTSFLHPEVNYLNLILCEGKEVRSRLENILRLWQSRPNLRTELLADFARFMQKQTKSSRERGAMISWPFRKAFASCLSAAADCKSSWRPCWRVRGVGWSLIRGTSHFEASAGKWNASSIFYLIARFLLWRMVVEMSTHVNPDRC